MLNHIKNYRDGIGIMLVKNKELVFTGKRLGIYSWQMPQCSMIPGENPWHAVLRELSEKVGRNVHIELIATHTKWLKYKFPEKKIRCGNVYYGQRQKWFLCRFLGEDNQINLNVSQKPEFEHWMWSPIHSIIDQVVDCKKVVYQGVLREFENVFKKYE